LSGEKNHTSSLCLYLFYGIHTYIQIYVGLKSISNLRVLKLNTLASLGFTPVVIRVKFGILDLWLD